MNTTVEKRRGVLINVAYFVLIIGAFYLFMRFAFWHVAPFLFAFFVAMMLQKPVCAVTKRTPLKKPLVSLIAVLLILLFVLGIIALTGATIYNELKELFGNISQTFNSIPDFIESAENWLLGLLDYLPAAIRNSLAGSISTFSESIMSAFSEGDIPKQTAPSTELNFDFSSLKTPLSGVISTASKVPSFIVAVIVFFIACCFLTADYDRVVGFIKRQLPEEKRDALSKTKKLTLSTLGKMIKAYFLIICITCTELFIGLTALELLGLYTGGYKLLIAFCIALVDIFPILGSGTVLIPWGIISLLTGNIGRGIGLLVIYVIISVLRQYIEPKLVAGQLGLPPIATLICMYLGVKIFGVIGIFLLPLLLTIIKVLNDDGVIHLWNSKKADGESSVQLKIPGFKNNKKRKEGKTK